MPVVNRIADFAEEMKVWRRHLHQHPELGFDCHETAGFVVERLREFGVDEIHMGIARSGVVAIINGTGQGPTIGLRADMDALPMLEQTGAAYASLTPGRMHACGHDGHTTMLLGAAKYLCETRRFGGRVALIFQPAEEDGGGGEVMVREGVMDRFAIAQVYALHTSSVLPLGHFSGNPGPAMAAVDTAYVTVTGRAGHAAQPHLCTDPIVAAVAMVTAAQTIISRNVYAMDQAVVSFTQIHAGTTHNVIPETASFCASVRTFSTEVRALIEQRFAQIVAGTATAYGVQAELTYERSYPPMINDAAKIDFAAEVARDLVGAAAVNVRALPGMTSEDFSYMLNVRPGALLWLGQGVGPGLHNTAFDFNDEVAAVGASFFARLVETAQPPG